MSFKSKINLFDGKDCKPVNCRISGGELIPALYAVPKEGTAPQDVLIAAYSAGTKQFYICTDEGVYVSSNGRGFMRIGTLNGESPYMVELIDGGKPTGALINGKNAFLNSGRTNRALYQIAELSCGAMHCGRLFGADMADGFKLRWSGENGLEDWEEGIYGSGSLTLDPARGEILDLLEFGEKLIAVREYGLTVLNMFGSPENFSAELTDTDTDKIYKGTARVAGGKLIFLTASGLKSFDGSRISVIDHRYSGDIDNPLCSAASGDKYYLSCEVKSVGCYAVLCYGVSDGESSITEVHAKAMCVSDKIFVYGPAGVSVLEESGDFYLMRNNIDFGSERLKTVTDAYIDGEADIFIYNGRVTRSFYGVKGHIRPSLRGESFNVFLQGTKRIRSVTLTAEECNAI